MATFTMELREVLETFFGPGQEYVEYRFKESTYGRLPAIPNPTIIGLGTYPIFNEEYRPILNGKIVDEYFTREIGTESIDNWTLMVRRKMDQIMPYYNQMYLSQEIPYSALDTMKIHTVGKTIAEELAEANTIAENTSVNSGSGRAVQSNTPQTMLSGNEDYATAATDTVNDSETTANSEGKTDSTSNTEANVDNLVTGYQAVASDLITKYRATLINVDTAVILELQDCFMQMLNNGDSYTNNHYNYGWVY